MGNLPLLASCVAAIKPIVAAGNTTNANAAPINGICDTNEINAMNMKNKPPKASGCLKNVLMPDLTHAMPVRAGTTLREIADVVAVEGEFEDDMKGLIYKQIGLTKLI